VSGYNCPSFCMCDACSNIHVPRTQKGSDADLRGRIEELESEVSSLRSFKKEVMEVQKENEELRDKLKLLEMNQHFMEKEIKEGGK
jgi:predicted nuclease with TOPRIM domain